MRYVCADRLTNNNAEWIGCNGMDDSKPCDLRFCDDSSASRARSHGLPLCTGTGNSRKRAREVSGLADEVVSGERECED